LIGGNRVELIRREPDEKIIGALRKRVREFWESIDANQEPKPDFARDNSMISKLYGYAEPGKLIQATEEMTAIAKRYTAAAATAKKAEGEKTGARAELLTMIGTAEKVLGEGFSISAGVVGPADVAYRRESYRNFRVNWKKAKKTKEAKS